MINAIMVCPTSSGGHPLYITELLAAMARQAGPDFSLGLLAPTDLEVRFRNLPCPIHDVLPPEPKRNGAGPLRWQTKVARRILRTERAALRWLRGKKIDVLHFQGLFWLSAPFLRSYRRLGLSLINTIHNLRPHKYSGPLPPRVEDAVHGWMLRQCDGLIVHTQKLREEAARMLGPRHPPIFVAPHGLFQPPFRDKLPPLAERLGWKKALVFGAVRRDKGAHLAVAAMKELDGFHLTIAGHHAEPDYWRECVEPLLVEVRSLSRSVQVIDRFVEEQEAAKLFATHSFALLPYTPAFQAQSGVLHLALGMETPALATAVGGIPEIVAEWDVGEIMPPESPQAIVEAVRRLYTRDVARLAENLRRAKDSLSWEKAAELTLQAYKQIYELRRSKTTDAVLMR